jgi:predicted ATPase with chaperone activity
MLQGVKRFALPPDFGEVKGQEHVKRAFEVAAAGGYNVFTFCTKSLVLLDPVYAWP